MMSRKHFNLIAQAMQSQVGMLGHKETCEALCIALAGTNPLFDKVCFLKACGVIQ